MVCLHSRSPAPRPTLRGMNTAFACTAAGSEAPLCADPDLDQFATLPGGMRLCYRTYGHPQNPALVLVAGLGLQLVSWPQVWIDHLVQAGLYVVVPDNRDVGRSTHLRACGAWP